MHYERRQSLLPVLPQELLNAQRVPFRELPDNGLLVFDDSVSNFYFEFEPREDIERFLQHAHFAARKAGRLIICREDLFGVAAIQRGEEPATHVVVDVNSELPWPLRDRPVRESFAEISRGGEFQGQLTVCSCHIAGCSSQYAWVRDCRCIALFTIRAATLTEVEWFGFRLEVRNA